MIVENTISVTDKMIFEQTVFYERLEDSFTLVELDGDIKISSFWHSPRKLSVMLVQVCRKLIV